MDSEETMSTGPNTEELREALEDEKILGRALPENKIRRSTAHIRTLAAAYREAIEALREYHDIWPDIDHEANAKSCKACAVLAKANEAENGNH